VKNAKMRKISLRAALISTVLIAAVVGAVVWAAVQVTRNISNEVQVSTEYNIEVYDETLTTLITSINWGTVDAGVSKTSAVMKIKNIGNMEVYVAWKTTSLPTGFQMDGEYMDSAASGWYIWPENSYERLNPDNPAEKYPTLIQPDTIKDCRFTLENIECGPGTFSFTLTIKGADSSTG
jgi:hypothetical protein